MNVDENVGPVPAASVDVTEPVGVTMPAEERVTRYELFAFSGSGSEYFRIWIVNLFLSVVTLGIYSAWAKVRTQQYFYRHTSISGASFDYHGTPVAILKGRLLSVALFGSYYAAGTMSPAAGGIAFLLLAAVMPWLMMRSLRFRLHNSSYRGLRFRFAGSTRDAYWVFLVLPIMSVLTLLGLAPYWHYRMKRYQHGEAWYGRTPFTFDAPVSAFYRAYGAIVLCTIGLLILTLFMLFMFMWATGLAFLGDPEAAGSVVVVAVLLAYVFMLTGTWSLMTCLIQNVVWRHTALGPHRFRSTLEPHRLVAITLMNLLGTIVTLGLFKPFAQVRVARYMASEMTLVTDGDLDEFVSAGSGDVSAVGDEALDIFDIELSL